eukprot:CAMPEP_0168337904 /NCGR_PEP_ID=MMETSP0213-20121227/12489_1 /TAXON_ID=151035 /ORGANISM="Euplotes harpa, Strain FSP1.4" /LENGTH=212 /DNA_ID=CAMNT_0008343525 /DNA_START=97 /DNA_END=732 /DNA_ORIENTATION=-
MLVIFQNKSYIHFIQRLYSLYSKQLAEVFLGERRWIFESRNLNILVFDSAKLRNNQLFELIQSFVRVDHQLHDVGRVPFVIKSLELVIDPVFAKRVQVAAKEPVVDALLVGRAAEQLPEALVVALQIPLVLRVDCVHLLLDAVSVQQRGNEHVREDVESLLQALVCNTEVEVRVEVVRVRVVVSAVVQNKIVVLVRNRILLSSHEKHVLEEM